MTRPILLACAVLLAGAPGCAGGVGPEPREEERSSVLPHQEVVHDGIRARLSLDRTEVERTRSLVARLTLTNTRGQTATWTSGAGCLAFLGVYRGARRYPFRGTDFACLAVVSTWAIAPGDSLVREWVLQAQTTDGTPLPAGEYVLEADLISASGLKLRRAFTVR
jgi:hypothetical protein